MPVAAALIQHDAAVFWREEESPLALSDWGCRQSQCCYLYRGVLLHPQTQEFRPGSSCHRSDWRGLRKISPSLYQHVCSVSDSRPMSECFFTKEGDWCPVHFGNWQNYMMAEQALFLLFRKHLCYEDQCMYTFMSLWDMGTWKSWRGKTIHSVCQQFSQRRLNP